VNSDELKSRAKQFAHRCVKFATTLPKTALGNVVRNQLIRSATSTAANYRAACLAQTKAAFSSKISITLEEADES
jgi:four helix bundle protein